MALGLVLALAPLIPHIIQGVESLIGSKNGKQKKDIAVEMASAATKKLRESGVLEGNEGAQDVAALVETAFQILKASGQLREIKEPGPESPSSPASTQRVVFEGTLKTL